MSRWFRVYAELVDDPKFIKLGPDLRSALLMTWCVAASNEGILPPLEDIALKFRLSETRTQKLMNELRRCGFVDDTEAGPTPHNWKGRQFQSDVSTDRVKRFRDKKRNDDETFHDRSTKRVFAVTETPPESEQNRTENAAVAAPPADPSEPEREYFRRSVEVLGEKGRSIAAKLLHVKGKNVALARAAIEQASTKQEPREFIGAIIRNRDGADDLRARGDAW